MEEAWKGGRKVTQPQDATTTKVLGASATSCLRVTLSGSRQAMAHERTRMDGRRLCIVIRTGTDRSLESHLCGIDLDLLWIRDMQGRWHPSAEARPWNDVSEDVIHQH